jgi:hypothetical protein
MIWYASKLEALEALRHDREKKAGQIVAWAVQVSIPIGLGPRGYRRHIVDFFAVLPNGKLRVRETKGIDHAMGRQKRNDLEAMGFEVELVR